MQISIIKTKEEYFRISKDFEDKTIGFVPTMGNLHQGHLSLLKESAKTNDINVLSIFVNPTQFAEGEDLDLYPRTLEADIKAVEVIANEFAEKEFFIFTPTTQDIYGDNPQTTISVSPLNKILEGEFRPTHFDGVATVVYLLFNIVKPQHSYFGQKDYQQLIIIKKMVADLGLTTQVHGLPIVRDEDGLALSSRNQYLTNEQRQKALTLPRTLLELKSLLAEETIDNVVEKIETIKKEDQNWNYLELRDANDLGAISSLDNLDNLDKNLVLVATYQLGQTRLLDNRIITR